ncbi:PIR protein [Plasmodium ovale]|uniref:PIR protein n=1 Tax=Plasmodium ovale TaxID=36330 RepID=A0A1C3KKZ3_PLAOA|nr:PIR protein [Plasmodium ovale]
MHLLEREKYYSKANKFPQCKNEFDTFSKTSDGIFKYRCEDIFKNFEGSDSIYITPCVEVLKYIDYLNKNEFLHQNTEYCMFLNYSLNNHMQSIPENKYNSSKFYKKIKTEYTGSPLNFDICDEEIKDINAIVRYHIEVLYNLYENFNKYISSCIPGSVPNCYFSDLCASIYKNSIEVCKTLFDTSFCNILKTFKDEYNAQIVRENSCYKTENVLSYPEVAYISKYLQAREGYVSLTNGYHMIGSNISPELYSAKHNIIIAVIVLLLIPFILFIMYKFTPFGSWLHSRAMKYNGIIEYMDEYDKKIHTGNSIKEQNTNEDNTYNITYNSLSQF